MSVFCQSCVSLSTTVAGPCRQSVMVVRGRGGGGRKEDLGQEGVEAPHCATSRPFLLRSFYPRPPTLPLHRKNLLVKVMNGAWSRRKRHQVRFGFVSRALQAAHPTGHFPKRSKLLTWESSNDSPNQCQGPSPTSFFALRLVSPISVCLKSVRKYLQTCPSARI